MENVNIKEAQVRAKFPILFLKKGIISLFKKKPAEEKPLIVEDQDLIVELNEILIQKDKLNEELSAKN